MTQLMERPVAETPSPASTASGSGGTTPETAQEAVLRLASRPGGVRLGEARKTASGNLHANARAIVRLISSGLLKLTEDRRLVPGPRQ
jgi:hypothetical protein